MSPNETATIGATADEPSTEMDTTAEAVSEATSGATKTIDDTSLVPQLEAQGVTYEQLKTAIDVLNAVATLKPKKKRKPVPSTNNNNDDGDTSQKKLPPTETDSLEQYKHPNLRPFRKALASCLELHQRTMYQGQAETDYYDNRQRERSLKRQKMAERDLQKKHIATTHLRQGRVERLNAKLLEAEQEERDKLRQMMIPDGHVETANTTTTPLLLTNENRDSKSDPNDETAITTTSNAAPPPPVQLPILRSCYVCKIRYRDLHHFYDQLCPTCATLNWEKRHATADLTGKVCLVTGARVKIGLHVCLKLLRAGATVVATTRFPNKAVEAYRAQADATTWWSRLHLYGLDLRDVAGLEAFGRFLKQRYATTGVDCLINNACQTIRRPAGYYAPILQQEQALWGTADETHKQVLEGCVEFERLRRRILLDQRGQTQARGNNIPRIAPILPQPQPSTISALEEDGKIAAVNSDKGSSTAIVAASLPTVVTVQESTEETASPFETTGLSHSAAMSQMIILEEDAGVSSDILPPGISDINGQQLDLRTTNSWLLKMEEVSTPELMECMFVNAIAPFVLNSRLKPLMTVPMNDTRPNRFIINVSAMEGKFYRFKTECHPHTNMAKAALNMATRTSSENWAKVHRIYMNSVDTGWINDENPLDKASKIAKNNNFQTPIDEIDAAARILDPIFSSVNGGDSVYGKFLKDYKESEW